MITHALHVALLGNGATPHEILESMAWKLEEWFSNILKAWAEGLIIAVLHHHLRWPKSFVKN